MKKLKALLLVFLGVALVTGCHHPTGKNTLLGPITDPDSSLILKPVDVHVDTLTPAPPDTLHPRIVEDPVVPPITEFIELPLALAWTEVDSVLSANPGRRLMSTNELMERGDSLKKFAYWSSEEVGSGFQKCITGQAWLPVREVISPWNQKWFVVLKTK